MFCSYSGVAVSPSDNYSRMHPGTDSVFRPFQYAQVVGDQVVWPRGRKLRNLCRLGFGFERMDVDLRV